MHRGALILWWVRRAALYEQLVLWEAYLITQALGWLTMRLGASLVLLL
jgi:hypothetical protein